MNKEVSAAGSESDEGRGGGEAAAKVGSLSQIPLLLFLNLHVIVGRVQEGRGGQSPHRQPSQPLFDIMFNVSSTLPLPRLVYDRVPR